MFKQEQDKENQNQIASERKSPSKMTDQEKVAYANKIYRESEDLQYNVQRKLSKYANITNDIKTTISECKMLQEKYQKEQVHYSEKLEQKRKALVNNHNFLNLPNDMK